ncbi:hypothetical protein PoB_004662800 [Plakobranchus ocellatus]|uniref:Uncharacterized protein n=1 Tax=Plakobranchus ocellatus TaxID=259542 RepID=A0AAV4BKL4_9GAST|nr:hypothetical protein PoB_004662800 [Plakobranchus ocellatus]
MPRGGQGAAWILSVGESTTRGFQAFMPPTGHGAGGGVRTRDRRSPADLRADSLTTEPPTPQPWRKRPYLKRTTKEICKYSNRDR